MCHSGRDLESFLQVGTHFEELMPENKFSMTTSFLFIFQRSLILIFLRRNYEKFNTYLHYFVHCFL